MRVAESYLSRIGDLESFEDFDEPTVGGFIDQVLIAGQ